MIYVNGIYDILPAYMSWSVNGIERQSFDYFTKQNLPLNTLDITFDWSGVDFSNVGTFREECLNAAKKVIADADGKTIAVSLSGSDSEIIVRCLHLLKANYELYHQTYWFVDDDQNHQLINSQKVAHAVNKPLNIIRFTEEESIYAVKKNTIDYGIFSRGYYIILDFWERIPSDRFIVGGEGDLEKSYNGYKKAYIKKFGSIENGIEYIPFASNEILFRIWAQRNERHGQYYFFSSTPELMYATIHDDGLISYTNGKFIWDISELKRKHWSENICPSGINVFWDNPDIFDMLGNISRQSRKEEWKGYAGSGFCTFIKKDDFFKQ